jgi:hypothetical protein
MKRRSCALLRVAVEGRTLGLSLGGGQSPDWSGYQTSPLALHLSRMRVYQQISCLESDKVYS